MTAAEFVEEFALRLRSAVAGHSLGFTYTLTGFESYKAVILGIFDEMGITWNNATWITDGAVSYGQDIAIATGAPAHETPHQTQPERQVEPPVGSLDTQERHEPDA